MSRAFLYSLLTLNLDNYEWETLLFGGESQDKDYILVWTRKVEDKGLLTSIRCWSTKELTNQK